MKLSALYIIFASCLWGIDGFMRQSSPISGNLLIALEMSIAGLVLLPFVVYFRKSVYRKISHIKSFLAMVMLGGVAGSWCFFQALHSTDSLGFIFVLIGLQPVFTIMTSAIFLREHPRTSFYAFAATTIFASIMLTLGDTGFHLDKSALSGYIYALLTAICWGSSTTFGKIVVEHNSPTMTLCMRFLCTGIIAWIIVFFSGESTSLTTISTGFMTNPMNLLFIIFVSDILAYGVYLRGLKDVPATMATIFELAFPLTGFVLDYVLYDVVPSPIKVVAAFTILLSIVILPYCHFLEENTEARIPLPA